jgi:hypothetical protein
MNEKTISVKKGQGYYDLTWYPWGGAFRRFPENAELPVIEERKTPRGGILYIVAKYNGVTIGVRA